MPDETQPTPEKAGARHNSGDRAHLADIHAKAADIQAAALALGHELPTVVYTIGKAGGIPDGEEPPIIWGAVKAAGEWELDVLANPYGGPHLGKDADGQFFSPNTKFHEDQIPLPPVVYYHGYGDDKRPTGLPEFIGRSVKRWVDNLGVWYHVVLDQTKEGAKRVWKDANAKPPKARASTGVVLATHRVDQKSGEILSWLNGELSIFETSTGKRPANGYAVALPALKAVYDQAGLTLPDLNETPATPQTDTKGATGPVAVARSAKPEKHATEKHTMTPEEIEAAALAKIQADEEALAASNAAEVEKFAAGMKAGMAKAEKAAAEKIAKAEKALADARAETERSERRPAIGAPAVLKFANTSKYDSLGVDDMAFMVGLLDAAKKKDGQLEGVTKSAAQALAIKMAEDKTVIKRRNGVEMNLGNMAHNTLKAAGLDPADVLNAQKANELDYSTQAGFGDEWVFAENSNRLWERIRAMTAVVDKIPEIVVPQGAESIVIPLEAADPTWYKVAQTTATNGTTGRPDATVTSSKLATDQKTVTVAKMGARTLFSGELVEDSIIPWVSQLRKQLETSGAEMLEHLVIDGDTDATASTNINAIDTTPDATTLFLLLNGFRKSPLVTTTANSRSASGAFVDTDFLNTVKLMGTAGLNAQDKTKVEFILDANTYWKALELSNVKTIETFRNATLENGVLTSIWGYPVRQSYFMHYTSAKRMTNSAGKIDADTDSNNTLGAILAVRYDQWLFAYKRRMTIKLQEFIDADTTQIVALARVGLAQRDTEASALTYNVLVA